MTNLTKASEELFRRSPDEIFPTVQALFEHCYRQREASTDRWHPPNVLSTKADEYTLLMNLGTDGAFSLNDWSFSSLCRLAGVSKDTVNRLSTATASIVLEETLPRNGSKPLQFLTEEKRIRSIHGASYTRLWNADLLSIVREFATDFQPPQKGVTGGTGLYCGEQDLFVFLIDPLGWTEIEGETFAPDSSSTIQRLVAGRWAAKLFGFKAFAKTTWCGMSRRCASTPANTPRTSGRDFRKFVP